MFRIYYGRAIAFTLYNCKTAGGGAAVEAETLVEFASATACPLILIAIWKSMSIQISGQAFITL